jgi:hypothetical protein
MDLNTNHINSYITYSTDRVFGLPSGLQQELEWANDGSVTLLYRNSLHELISSLQKWHNQPNITYSGRLLRGAYGAGKSSTLYQIVHLCRNAGWIVLYICEAAAKAHLSPQEAAEEIVDDLFKHHNQQLAQLGLTKRQETDDSLSKLDSVLKTLRNQSTFPIFIAVDQWNAIFQKNIAEDHALKRFANFKTVSPNRGVYFCAFSSTFDPHPHMNDHDAYQYTTFIPPYTELEFNTHVNHTIQCNYLPPLTQQQIRELAEQTGRLPRLIFHLCLIKKPSDDASTLLKKMFTEGVNIYNNRLNKLLARLDEKEKNQFMKFLAEVYLNYTPKAINVPHRLYEAGLYIEDESEPRPVCAYVTRAILKTSTNVMPNMLELLSADKGFSWRALELFITKALSGGCDHSIHYDNGFPYGDRGRPALRIKLEREVYQQRGEDISKLFPGTLVVCYRNHGVIDLVAYTTFEDLIFIQISEQSYTEHARRSGYEHLFTKSIKFDGVNEETIYNYFVRRATDGEGNFKNPQNQLLDARAQSRNPLSWTYYLYITPLKAESTPHPGRATPVKIVNADFLREFGEEARYFVD